MTGAAQACPDQVHVLLGESQRPAHCEVIVFVPVRLHHAGGGMAGNSFEYMGDFMHQDVSDHHPYLAAIESVDTLEEHHHGAFVKACIGQGIRAGRLVLPAGPAANLRPPGRGPMVREPAMPSQRRVRWSSRRKLRFRRPSICQFLHSHPKSFRRRPFPTSIRAN